MSEQLARIKNIFFPISEYYFKHGPSDKEGPPNKDFLGRSEALLKLEQRLTPNDKSTNKGTYLVAGYRGMGKTSVVREVVKKINKPKNQNEVNKSNPEPNKIETFEIYLSQNEIKDEDILRQVAAKLIGFINDSKNNEEKIFEFDKEPKPRSIFLKYSIYLFVTGFVFFRFILDTNQSKYKLGNKWDHLKNIPTYFKECVSNVFLPKENTDHSNTVWLFFWLILTLIIIFFIEWILREYNDVKKKRFNQNSENKILLKINKIIKVLDNRLFSSMIEEDQKESDFQLEHSDMKLAIPQRLLNASKEFIEGEKKKTKSFSKLIPKEIEVHLTELLDAIHLLRKKREEIPHFVFVFDELDKIEPDYYFYPDNDSKENNNLNITSSRKRIESIANILANLKSFLCNAQSKFVFIGGRSMYEAALADISDRESFYSSIFNDVIYIPSFYKDKSNSTLGVSQLTELYVCKLLSKGTDKEAESIDTLLQIYEEKNNLNDTQKFKILHSLQNFFIFLTYRTNGSPKKLIELVEKYIVDVEKENPLKDHLFSNGTNTTKYIKLNYKDQYEINLTSNFYRPYTIQNSRHLKLLNDKLLYSTAFLMDHILKFHKTAFSWNNLELLPDIILSNNDPNFRSFFMEIMNHFQDHFIRKTTNAIFQYKFQSKIAREIRLLSKRSEFSSAAVNFTLDESFHLKSHYKRQLYAKINEYKMNSSFDNSNNYIHSIGYLYTIIGDLYYYDEEYDDAVIYYADALQPFRNNIKNIKAMHQLLLFSSIKLKLGLCLEKMRSYDRAYSIYRSLIIETNLCYEILKRNEIKAVKNNNNTIKDENWEPPYKRIQSFMRSHIALLGVIEKQRQDGITYYNLERNLAEYVSFLGLMSSTNNENVKLFPNKGKNGDNILRYDEILGIESSNLGISSDGKRIVSLITDYYLSVGSILFFKNQVFYKLLFDKSFDNMSEYVVEALKNKCNDENNSYHPSHAAYLYFLHSLITFYVPFQENIKQYTDKNVYFRDREPNERSLIHEFKFTTSMLRAETYKILNTNQFEVLGNIFGKLGNSLISCLDAKHIKEFGSEECINYLKIIKQENLGLDEVNFVLNLNENEKINPLWTLICYRFSYLAYLKAGKSYNAYFAYHKIIKIYDEGLKCKIINKNNFNGSIFEKSEWERLIMLPIMLQTKVSNVANRPQITKYFDHLKWNQDDFNKMVLKNLSTAPEVRELIMNYESIMLSLNEKYIPRHSLGPFTSISSMYLRIIELTHQVRIEFGKIEEIRRNRNHEIFFDDLLPNNGLEIIKDQTFNGIFCIHEAIRILNNFGIDYTINYSMKAELLKYFGHFSLYYVMLSRGYKCQTDDIKTQMKNLTGEGIMHNLDPFAHFDHAIFCFEKVLQLHTEGSTYKEFTQEMFALDDDLNDSQNHFNAALERMKMNSEYIQNQIDILKETISGTQLNNIDNYLDSK